MRELLHQKREMLLGVLGLSSLLLIIVGGVILDQRLTESRAEAQRLAAREARERQDEQASVQRLAMEEQRKEQARLQAEQRRREEELLDAQVRAFQAQMEDAEWRTERARQQAAARTEAPKATGDRERIDPNVGYLRWRADASKAVPVYSHRRRRRPADERQLRLWISDGTAVLVAPNTKAWQGDGEALFGGRKHVVIAEGPAMGFEGWTVREAWSYTR